MTFPLELLINEAAAGERLDAFLAGELSGFSRAAIRRAIDAGHVTLDGERPKPSHRLAAGQRIVVASIEATREGPRPEAIDLDLLYEDDDLAVVNKPPGMVVHPAKGHWAGTLAGALAYHFGGALSAAGGPTRPGIVHRLDRDTSGVIVVAKHDRAHGRLADQFKRRTVEKQYLAIVAGAPDRDADVIDRPIGAHPTAREKMAIRADHPTSREAVTRYEVAERLGRFAIVRCYPKTGRTHQIRLHLAHIGHSVLCDKLYGGRSVLTADEAAGSTPGGEVLLDRQALHAERLVIDHPSTGERLGFEAPTPLDFQRVLNQLRKTATAPRQTLP